MPIDKNSLEELRGLVFKLPLKQLELLVRRFSGADSDSDACDLTSPPVPQSTLVGWRKKPTFARAYELFQEGGPEVFQPLIGYVYDAVAATAVIEQSKLIESPTKDLDSRSAASKYIAIADVLDRVVPKKTVTEHRYTFRLEDVVPPLVLESPIIEGEAKIV